MNISVAAGSFIPGFFFSGVNEESFDASNVKDRSYDLVFLEFLIAAGICILSILFFRSRAPSPPSWAAEKELKGEGNKGEVQKRVNEDFKAIIKNGNFWLIFISYILFFGMSRAFLNGFPFFIKPYGITDSVKVAILEVSSLPTGLIASAIIFYFLKKTPFYKKAYIFCIFITIIFKILFYFSL
jgi:Na+/melibiose symporter-like transporter